MDTNRMHTYHNTSFLGLPEFRVSPITEIENCIYLRIEKASSFETCPDCNTSSNKVHDRRKQPIRDLPISGKSVILALIKRRFRCPDCGKVFSETYNSISRYQRMTQRLIAHITLEATKFTFKAAAQNAGVSEHLARMLFVRRANNIIVNKTAPTTLAMDEFAVKKGKGENKYNLAIAVPTERRLLDILPNRYQATVEQYLRTLENKDAVQVVAIDMWQPYKRAIQKVLPKAAIVVDRFHVVRNMMWALDRVRRRIVEGNKELRTKLKRSRYLLLKNYIELDDKGQKKVLELLECSEALKQAYWLKEWFRGLYYNQHYETAVDQLEDWLCAAFNSKIPEIHYVMKTIQRWKQEILNYFRHRITTGFLEGINNKIKTIKRMAFGFRTPGILRAKALLTN